MSIHSEFKPLITQLKDLKLINDLITINNRLCAIIKTLITTPSWLTDKYFEVDPTAGFNGYKIHEEPDHTMAVFVTSWLPGRGAPPHNHGTWSISAGVVSAETHTFWDRLEDNKRTNQIIIKENKKLICYPGNIIALNHNDIHSVINESNEIAISLQIYGKHPHFTDRVQIDPITYKTSSFIGKEK